MEGGDRYVHPWMEQKSKREEGIKYPTGPLLFFFFFFDK